MVPARKHGRYAISLFYKLWSARTHSHNHFPSFPQQASASAHMVKPNKNKNKSQATDKKDDDQDIDKILNELNMDEAKKATAKKAKKTKKAKGQEAPSSSGGAGPIEGESSEVVAETGTDEPAGTSGEIAEDQAYSSGEEIQQAEAKDPLRFDTPPEKIPVHDDELELDMADRTKDHLADNTDPSLKPTFTVSPLGDQKIADLQQHSGIDILRPARGKNTFHVRTNHFQLFCHTKKDCVLYVYRLDGIQSDRTRAKKRMLVQGAIDRCSLLSSEESNFCTDYMDKIVAWKNLSTTAGVQVGDVIAHIPLMDYNRSTHSGTELELSLVWERTIDLHDLENFANGTDPTYADKNEAIAAMGLVFDKHILAPGHGTFLAGKNRIFLKSGWEELDSDKSKVVFRGYSYVVRPAMGGLLLNFNTAMSLFYKPMTVIEYLQLNQEDGVADLIGVRVWVNFDRECEDEDTQKALNTRQARTKTISEFSDETAGQQYAYHETDSTGGQIRRSVWEHMQQHYDGLTAGSEDSWCVNTNPTSANTKAWFLAEDLYILPYQIYKRKLEGKLTSAMIKKACRTPNENVKAIMSEGLPALGIKGKSGRPQSVGDAGIRVRHEMLAVPARLIKPPNLRFQTPAVLDTTRERTLGMWNIDNLTALLNSTTTRYSGGPAFFLLPGNINGKKETELLTYIQLFFQHHATLGVNGLGLGAAPAAFTQSNSRRMAGGRWDLRTVGTAVQAALVSQPSLVIIILPQKDKANLAKYSLFKTVMEQQEGLPSLCLCSSKLASSANARYKGGSAEPQQPDSAFAGYARNVGLKLNVRLGNVNHSLQQANFNVLPQTAGNTDTIILGADVIHPGVLSVEGTPSIAALVGSIDGEYGKYLGSMRRQPYDKASQSKEIVDDNNMKAMVEERLNAWKAQQGRFPANILYYRDGVGDSQFDTLRTTEIRMIRAAYQTVVANTSQAGVQPCITAVVVSKRHNVRFYPDTGRASEKSSTSNCRPGTVVDTGVTSPYFFDFYLLSQHGLQGTARPTHYFVVENDMNIGVEQLQDLTNALCFTYQRSTTSVSYVPPAYYADHLCERGRAYVKEFFDGSDRLNHMGLTQRTAELDRMWARGGRPNGNPWRAALDGTMFWL